MENISTTVSMIKIGYVKQTIVSMIEDRLNSLTIIKIDYVQ